MLYVHAYGIEALFVLSWVVSSILVRTKYYLIGIVLLDWHARVWKMTLFGRSGPYLPMGLNQGLEKVYYRFCNTRYSTGICGIIPYQNWLFERAPVYRRYCMAAWYWYMYRLNLPQFHSVTTDHRELRLTTTAICGTSS